MSTGHGKKITRKRQLAIAALLQQPTVKDAAAVAGVGEATLIRWLGQDNNFKLEYRQARRRILDQAITNLLQATGSAVETLMEIMMDKDKPPSSRVVCAKSILDIALKSVELNDMVARVEKLETQINK